MITYRKNVIHALKLELTSVLSIIERSNKQVIAQGKGDNKICVSLEIENEFYEVVEDAVWSAPVIILNDGHIVISYDSDLNATVAYTKAVEQLNNPNIEFITL